MKKSLIIFALILTLFAGCNTKEVKKGAVLKDEPTIEGEADVSAEESKTINNEKGEKEDEKEKNVKIVENDGTCPEGWKIFIDNNFNYQICFPETWTVEKDGIKEPIQNVSALSRRQFWLKDSSSDFGEAFSFDVGVDEITSKNQDSCKGSITEDRSIKVREVGNDFLWAGDWCVKTKWIYDVSSLSNSQTKEDNLKTLETAVNSFKFL